MARTSLKEAKADPKVRAKAEPNAEAESNPPRPKKKRGALKWVVVLALLVGAGGAGAWFILQESEAAVPARPGADKAAAVNKAVASKPPVFLALDAFTVNLQREDLAPQYLQVGLSLKVTDAKIADEVKLRMPEIRNRVLLVLANKKASEISTSEQKRLLSTELMREISQPLAGSPAAKAVESVLYTSFVVQ